MKLILDIFSTYLFIFVIENENVLEDFLNGNGRGIVNINLLETANFHKQSLSADTWKMCQPDTNIGGSSQISEAFSYEIFAQGRNAQLEKTEKEIVRLLEKGKKIAIDYVCKIHGVSVGVSVTRAVKFRKDYLDNNINKFCGSFAEKDARKLLGKKMNDLKDISEQQENRIWDKQILHVWVPNQVIANIVSRVASTILNDHDSNTLVVISKAKESCIFNNNIKQLQGM